MVLLICFDLPRNTKKQRTQATKYRKRLTQLGFYMKQCSVYEREIRKNATKNRIIKVLRGELPTKGEITLYVLPDEVNDQQVTILGDRKVQKTIRQAQFIVL
ncbi:CRISPR-associated endonuclease Cas2 [Ligilactobacillus acidipiscis]|nr:CRISPR-associated endonuclease Cas2 [Ligilactobacillus acidipiscis]